MLIASQNQTSFIGLGRALNVPAGAIVQWTGLVADIPANWVLCDGANGTPDFAGFFVRGADTTYPAGSTGGGEIVGTTSTDGAHTGPYNAPGNRSSSPPNAYGRLADGGHNHTVTGTVSEPLGYEAALIMATIEAPLPAGSIVMIDNGQTVPFAQTFNDLEGALMKGVTNDDRGQIGSETRTYDLTTSTAGAHSHGPGFVGGSSGPSTRDYSGTSRGSHNHGSISSDTFTDLPPYFVIQPLIIIDETGAYSKVIVGFEGDVSSLPEGWEECTALAGRFPVGAKPGLLPGETGGVEALNLSGSIPSLTVSHNHREGTSGTHSSWIAPHQTYAWVHDHTFSADVDVSPLFKTIHFIQRTTS